MTPLLVPCCVRRVQLMDWLEYFLHESVDNPRGAYLESFIVEQCVGLLGTRD